MKPLLRAALGALAGLVLAGEALAAPPGPPPAGDPCQRGPCAISGAAVRLTIPLARPAPGHFAGKFELVPLFDKGKPVIRNGHSYYAVRDALQFRRPNGELLTVPAGMQTDLASVPAFLWATLPPDGPYAEAATFHDECYRSAGEMTWHKHAGRDLAARPKPYARADCDEILREGMVALGVPDWKRLAVFEGVRMGGSKGFGH